MSPPAPTRGPGNFWLPIKSTERVLPLVPFAVSPASHFSPAPLGPEAGAGFSSTGLRLRPLKLQIIIGKCSSDTAPAGGLFPIAESSSSSSGVRSSWWRGQVRESWRRPEWDGNCAAMIVLGGARKIITRFASRLARQISFDYLARPGSQQKRPSQVGKWPRVSGGGGAAQHPPSYITHGARPARTGREKWSHVGAQVSQARWHRPSGLAMARCISSGLRISRANQAVGRRKKFSHTHTTHNSIGHNCQSNRVIIPQAQQARGSAPDKGRGSAAPAPECRGKSAAARGAH